MLTPNKPDWMPSMQGKYCAKRRPWGKIHQMVYLLRVLSTRKHKQPAWRRTSTIHDHRATPGATLVLQALGNALSILHMVFINILIQCNALLFIHLFVVFITNFAVQGSPSGPNARRQLRHFISIGSCCMAKGVESHPSCSLEVRSKVSVSPSCLLSTLNEPLYISAF